MPDALKTDANFVKGCMSTVHIAARPKPGAGDVIEFLGDSNTPIVKGLIARTWRVRRYPGRAWAYPRPLGTTKISCAALNSRGDAP